MTLIRRPRERPAPLRNALERMLTDWPGVPIDGGLTEVVPAIDVRDSGDAYMVEVEMPGANPDDIEVVIEGRTLTVRGRFAEQRELDEGSYLLRERRRGQFMRAVVLPGMVEIDKVSSKFEDGELIITLPKAAHDRARRVEIQEPGKEAKGRGRKKAAEEQTS
jgi:HSP20 family protein